MDKDGNVEWKLVEIVKGGIRKSVLFEEEVSDDESQNVQMNISILKQNSKKKVTFKEKWEQQQKQNNCLNQLQNIDLNPADAPMEEDNKVDPKL